MTLGLYFIISAIIFFVGSGLCLGLMDEQDRDAGELDGAVVCILFLVGLLWIVAIPGIVLCIGAYQLAKKLKEKK